MVLIKISEDKDTLPKQMFNGFKNHLRILHDDENDSIDLYLRAAIEGISTFGGNDVHYTRYSVFYPKKPNYRYPSTLYGWYSGKAPIHDITVKDATGLDITSKYTVDKEAGMIYPHPRNSQIEIGVGFQDAQMMPPHLVAIIYRYGAHLFENRESVRVGEPKMLPDWVNYAMASIWKPRV